MKSATFSTSTILLFSLSGCSMVEIPGLTPTPEPVASFVRTDTSPAAEARAAFVNVMSVAQRKDADAFRKLIYPADLPVFDDNERANRGSYQALMTAIASESLDDYSLELDDTTARFTAIPKQTLGDYDKKTPTTVFMVRDGNQWKIGAPPKARPLEMAETEGLPRRSPTTRSARHRKSPH